MTRTPIISGHAVQNFRDAYKNLLDGNGVRLVSDGDMLAANVEYLLCNPSERKRMVASAYQTVQQMQGSLKKTQFILDAYFFPLTEKRGLEEFS